MQTEQKPFDPNGPGLNNDKLFGLPISVEEAECVVIPVPWDATTSYRPGTSQGPEAILDASSQVEVYDPVLQDAWKPGIAMLGVPKDLIVLNKLARIQAEQIIDSLEMGRSIKNQPGLLAEVNQACSKMNQWVETQARDVLIKGKTVAVLGGDHSTPLGLIKALSEQHDRFGILQIDAHMDLREAYQGFLYSHASIMWNTCRIPQISKIVQVGVRDYCEEEVRFVEQSEGRIVSFPFRKLEQERFHGATWAEQVQDMIHHLPKKVYMSVDIDGLNPSLCPDTGTPVPGGLLFEEALFLVDSLVKSGRQIIGFDLCEVTPGRNAWNATVGARVLYRLYVAAVNSKLTNTKDEKRTGI